MKGTVEPSSSNRIAAAACSRPAPISAAIRAAGRLKSSFISGSGSRESDREYSFGRVRTPRPGRRFRGSGTAGLQLAKIDSYRHRLLSARISMCSSPQLTQTVGRFRLLNDYFACETGNFACELKIFACETGF